MSSHIYARYVPPAKKPPPAPKPSKPEPEPEPAQAEEEAHEHADSDDEEEDTRHEKLLSKRQKSLRTAEKLSRLAKPAESGSDHAIDLLETTEELHDLIPLPQPEPVPEPQLPSSTSLPPWLASPIRISQGTTAKFNDVGLQPSTVEALSSKGFKEAFAVQAAVLPLLLPGEPQQPGDVLVSAATGSGKTLAYVLPMVEDLSRHRVTRLRAVIVVPTRELVTQARDVSEICASAFSGERDRRRVKIGIAIGSGNFKSEQSQLMEQHLVYDPAGYKAHIAALDAKWQPQEGDSDLEIDELCGEETLPPLQDHVVKPAPKIDILICTPGRLVEHLKSTPGFSLQDLKWLVVDEADKLLDQSFQQWLDVVMEQLPKPSRFGRQEHVRKVILSATMTRDIGQLNGFKLYRPKLVVLEGSPSENVDEAAQGHVLPDLLVESAIKVEDETIKPLYLVEILRRQDLLNKNVPAAVGDSLDSESNLSSDDEVDDEADGFVPDAMDLDNEASSSTPHGVLIFTNSNESALRLGRLIALLEPTSASSVATLTSTTRNSTRRAALKSFQSGKLSILVASDLVSRGLDLPDLAHVINYDVPSSITSYVHRVGRTARAGKPGQAWTLFTGSEGKWFWNEVARSSAIRRLADAKIARVNIKSSHFDGERVMYEEALEALKKEASSKK
jgi:ATP-dependent RNA helicase DDX51/DBP6